MQRNVAPVGGRGGCDAVIIHLFHCIRIWYTSITLCKYNSPNIACVASGKVPASSVANADSGGWACWTSFRPCVILLSTRGTAGHPTHGISARTQVSSTATHIPAATRIVLITLTDHNPNTRVKRCSTNDEFHLTGCWKVNWSWLINILCTHFAQFILSMRRIINSSQLSYYIIVIRIKKKIASLSDFQVYLQVDGA